MKISLNWIKEFVNLDGISIEELENRFILSVAEIENIETKGKDISNCIAAKIIKCSKHPDSDKLKLLVVDTGEEKVDVVCGADNAEEGIIVPFVKLGGSNKKIPKVERTNIAGFDSMGVCCSEEELGISDNNSGLMILPDDIEIGTDIKDIIPIDDIIIEIDNKSLTHRPDLWGHYGIAREIAAITNRELKPLSMDELEDSLNKPSITVDVQSAKKCFRYSCISIDNIKKNKAPIYMAVRLYYCEMRSINLLVDLTNYIMLELGQPMHAFDKSFMPQVKLIDSQANDKFVTLDNEERILPEGTLMICNDKEPVAIAGVMGGLNSEVRPESTSILLESANFDGASVRKTALNLSLRTEASARFEKVLDPELTIIAIKRFVKLLRDVDPGIEISSSLTDNYIYKYPKINIEITQEYIERYMGISISEEKIIEILESLEFKVTKLDNSISIDVPSFRATKDISIKADIVEEVSRIYGYDNIEPVPYKSATTSLKINEFRALEHKIKELLCEGLNFCEVHSYVWFDDDLNKKLGIGKREGIKIINSVSGNSTLRDSLVPSMLYFSSLNSKNFDEFNILEIGSTFNGLNEDNLVNESNKLCILMASRKLNENDCFYKLKGILNKITSVTKAKDLSYVQLDKELPWIHPVKSSKLLMDDKDLGYMSVLNHNISQNIDKKLNIAFAEIDMDVLNDIDKKAIRFKDVSKYPGVDIDFTFLVDKNELFDTTKGNIESIDCNFINKISFVDSYIGKGVPDDKKSMTFNFLVKSSEKTLDGNEIESVRKTILDHLASKGYSLR